MRKWLFMILGVLLVAGAAGAFAVRYFYPGAERVAYRETVPDRLARRSRDFEQPRGALSGKHEGRAERDSESFEPGSLRLAEFLLNVLNTVVGVIGIGLWFAGSRMRGQSQTQSKM